jgi:alanine-synthesizing transaminase
MFSSRLRWDAATNPLAVLLAEKRRAGAEILDLTISNPTAAEFEYPREEILAALADERALSYQPEPRGLLATREAVAAWYAERGIDAPASRMLLTASTSEAYAFLFKLLCDPGGEVLVPRPSYPLFEFLAALESVAVWQYPLRYDGAWHVDFAALEAAIGQRTRAIVVVNPNNPTGSLLTAEEIETLDTLAAARGLAVISDEVFADYTFAGGHPTLIGDRHALTFSLNGLSKSAGLPQMKLGWMVASGPDSEAALDRLEWIADTYLSVAAPVQYAAPHWLRSSGPVRAQILDRTRANLALLEQAFAGSPFRALPCDGGWTAVIQAPRTKSEEQWVLDLLRDRNVLVQPGFFYDFESETYLVVSLLTPSKSLAEGIGRLAA